MSEPTITEEELAAIERAAEFQNNGAQSLHLIAALRAERAKNEWLQRELDHWRFRATIK